MDINIVATVLTIFSSKETVVPNWISTLTATNISAGTLNTIDMEVDENNNVYIIGTVKQPNNDQNTFLVKYNSTGAEVKQVKLTFQTYWEYPATILSMRLANNRLYVVSQIQTTSSGLSLTGVIQIYDTNLNLLSATNSPIISDFIANAQDEYFISQRSTSSFFKGAGYNLIFGKRVMMDQYNRDQNKGYAIDVDSSGNIYYVGGPLRNNDSTYGTLVITKYNSSGTRQWVVDYGDGIQFRFNSGAKIRIVGNFGYVVLNYAIFSGLYTYGTHIVKFDLNGTLQWQRNLTTSNEFAKYDVAIDASGNVYLVHIDSVIKYDSSGTVQWQRQFNGKPVKKVKALGNSYYVLGNDFVACLPADGSLTGTYGSYVYQSASYTSNTGSLGWSNSGVQEYAVDLNTIRFGYNAINTSITINNSLTNL